MAGQPIARTSIQIGADTSPADRDLSRLAGLVKGLGKELDRLGRDGGRKGLESLATGARQADQLRRKVGTIDSGLARSLARVGRGVSTANAAVQARSRLLNRDGATDVADAHVRRFGYAFRGGQRPTGRLQGGAAGLPTRADLLAPVAGPPVAVAPAPAVAARTPTAPAAAGGPGLLRRGLNAAAYGTTVGLGIGLAQQAAAFTGEIKQAVVESVRLAGQFEQVRIAFDTMLGSAEKADRLILGVRGLAVDSPLTFAGASKLAQGLLAANTAADQVVPTLRMLADVAAATGDDYRDSLQRVSYAYRQIASAGRLYGAELRQLTEANIPIIDALAVVLKKPVDMVRLLVEDGRVGFADVTRAFKLLTEEGGRFAGLSAKFGQSFLGRVERVKDSLEQFGREFGQVLIDELGLRDGARDVERFIGRLQSGLGDIRPAVRLVGDLGRAAAQTGFELARAGGLLAYSGFSGLARMFPWLDALPAKVRAVAKDLQEFRADPGKVIDLGLGLAEAAVRFADPLLGLLEVIGRKFDEKVLKPTEEWGSRLLATFTKIESIVSGINAVATAPQRAGAALGEQAANVAFPYRNYAPPPDPNKGWWQSTREWLGASNYALMYGTPPGRPGSGGPAPGPAGGRLTGGERVPLSPTAQAALASPAPKDAIGEAFAEARTQLQPFVDGLNRAKADRDRQRQRDAAGDFILANQNAVGAAGGAALAFAGLSDAAQRARAGLDGVRVSSELLDPVQKDLYLRLADPSKAGGPLAGFGRRVSDLLAVERVTQAAPSELFGTVAPADIAREAADIVDDLRRSAGLGETRLPAAAELGSREYARLEAGLATPGEANDVAGLLRALKEQERVAAARNAELLEAIRRELRPLAGPPVQIAPDE